MAFDKAANRERIATLRRWGVDVWSADRVYVAPNVDLAAIEPAAEIRHATLSGAGLRIASGAKIGFSGHAEIDDCQLGPHVELGAGLYRGATFLAGAKVRGFAEIRPATLLEEQAEAAHNVAFKNTTLTSCCVAGSLINFCDIFLSGGTSRLDHTEVGSGAIHFNFDPRGDKWGSMAGGARGVLLRSAPVFIGGQCGLVGPVEIGFGAVTAAGSMVRKSVAEGELAFQSVRGMKVPGFDRRVYGKLQGKFLATAKLVGTLWALDAWYETVRLPFAAGGERLLYQAARGRLAAQRSERVRRLAAVVEKLPESIALNSERGRGRSPAVEQEHRALIDGWDRLRRALQEGPDFPPPPTAFLAAYGDGRSAGASHLEALRLADAGVSETGRWLDDIVQRVQGRAGRAIGLHRA